MSKESIIKGNRWKDVVVSDLLSSVPKYIYSSDFEHLDKIDSILAKDDYKFHFELPPEPWQGNPLEAKVVILTLNPGYVEAANTVIAKLLMKASCKQELCDFKSKVLRLESDSLMPEITNNESGEVSLFEAFNALGDWYWYRGLSKLREDYIRKKGKCGGEDEKRDLENKFYKNFAILEYCPYTSKQYKGMKAIDELPSVRYSVQVLKEIAGDNNRIIILHRGREWKKHLDKGGYVQLKNPRCPYLSIGNMEEEDYQKLLDMLE